MKDCFVQNNVSDFVDVILIEHDVDILIDLFLSRDSTTNADEKNLRRELRALS